jgi:hypothetical protein
MNNKKQQQKRGSTQRQKIENNETLTKAKIKRADNVNLNGIAANKHY